MASWKLATGPNPRQRRTQWHRLQNLFLIVENPAIPAVDDTAGAQALPGIARRDLATASPSRAAARAHPNASGKADYRMLTIMLMRMGSSDITVESMTAVLRDLARSMAAAARRDNNEDVLVWEPNVSTDRTSKIECKRVTRPLIVPIQWRKFTAQLVLCME